MTDYADFTLTTAIYRETCKTDAERIAYCAFGLAGETGEVSEKLKKLIRGAGMTALSDLSASTKSELEKELGDILFYIARLADELGTNLNNVANTNMTKLKSRKDRGVLHGSGDNR